MIRWRKGLPRWLSGKEAVCNVGDVDLIPGSGRSLGGRVQYHFISKTQASSDFGIQGGPGNNLPSAENKERLYNNPHNFD